MDNTFTLQNISDRTNGTIIIDIPSLQRGLVWKPKQVEFLWDSIIRGFPIGGFILSENTNNKYDLMDGQQRFNAIGLGFEEPKKDSKSILWIDIDFEQKDEPRSSRKFFVKATTTAHPWGYNNDDDCKLLSAKDRKDALEKFGFPNGTNIYKNPINLIETYPFKSRLPIPLAYILNSIDKNREVFASNVIEKCEKSNCSTWLLKIWNTENNVKREKLLEWINKNFETLLLLDEYTLPFSLLPKSTIDNEDKIENIQESDQTDLEVLFQRLNTGGTQISRDDLMYSAIKAYWGSIKNDNENLATGLMPPQYLIQILFRLILTEINKETDKFEPPISIQKIRKLAKDNEIHQKIDDFFKSESINRIREQLLELTESENNYYAIPKYVLMKIVKEKPDLILFVMYLLRKDSKISKENLIGLILYLYWFSCNTAEVINTLYRKCKESSDEDIAIKEGLADLTYERKLQNIYTPEEIEKVIDKEKQESLIDNLINTPAGKFIRSITWEPQKYSTSKTILLYSQRGFLSENFREYNPSDTLSWEDHNCPWDYDHIFPQNKLNTFKQVQYRERIQFWLWSIGNFAAIPFEENRAKSDSNNYDYYKNDGRESILFFDKDFEKVEPHSNDNEAKKAALFEKIVFNRMIKLYSECYNTFESFVPNIDYSNKAKERKTYLEILQSKIKEKCSDCITDFYFVRESNEIQDYQLQFPQDWFRFCISLKTNVEKLNNTDCMISFTWNHSYKDSCEFGLRGTNTKTDKIKYLETNNCCSKLENLIKDYSIVNKNSSWKEGEWWYQGYHINKPVESEKIDSFIDSLAELYVALYKELSS